MSDRASPFSGVRIAVVGPFPPRSGELSGQTELLCRLLHAEGAWVQRVNTDVPGVRRLPRIGIHLLPIAQVLALCWRLLVALPRSDLLHVQAASYWGFYLPVLMALLFGKLGRRRVVISYSGGMARSFVHALLALAAAAAAAGRWAGDHLGLWAGDLAALRPAGVGCAQPAGAGDLSAAGQDKLAAAAAVAGRAGAARQPADGAAGLCPAAPEHA